MPVRVVVLEGDETGQELLEEALRVLSPDVVGVEFDLAGDELAAGVVTDRDEQAGRVERGLGRLPSVLVPWSERRYRSFSARTDLRLARYLRGLDGGVLVATRPGLAVATARWAPPASAAASVAPASAPARAWRSPA